MGSFTAVERPNASDLSKSNRLWGSYNDHIVSLSEDFHILFAPKPISSYTNNSQDPDLYKPWDNNQR